jgi:uncharacterized membrane protein
MFERSYRQRLEADLARWQEAGLLAPATGNAIRAALGPMPRGVNIATVVAVVGGLLIAAAFLAFVAANWTAIARPARLVVLLVGIAGAYAIAALGAQTRRPVIADLGAAVGAIIFGAGIALIGQMYHLAEDFAGGMLFWAIGALIGAALTSSRGALAVALFAAGLWTGMHSFELGDAPHLPFLVFWLVAALLAVAWDAPAARHLVAIAAVAWWLMVAFAPFSLFGHFDPRPTVVAGGALMLGGGLFLSVLPGLALRAFGATQAAYGAFLLAGAASSFSFIWSERPTAAPVWIVTCVGVGVVLAFAAAALQRRAGPLFAALSIGLALAVMTGIGQVQTTGEPWLVYALSLLSMLALIISGMLDDVRPRIVAGWLGLATVIVGITWSVKGSLLRRAFFLLVAGCVAIVLAILLGRLMPREEER